MSSADVTNTISGLYGFIRDSTWTHRWARLGFFTSGIVYLIIGCIAALVAFYHRGRIASPEGAIERIGKQPFGSVLLVLVGFGLFGLAVWRLIQAFSDTDDDGADFKGKIIRAGVFCSGLGYLTLATFAFHRVFGSHTGRTDAARHWTAILLAHSWGVWLVGAVGLVLIGVGISELIFGLGEKFRPYLRMGEVSAADQHWILQCGKYGYSAQGIVLGLIGGFLMIAALRSDPRSARGLDGALAALANEAYGPWMLGIVALGLVAYGLFMLVQARYRRFS